VIDLDAMKRGSIAKKAGRKAKIEQLRRGESDEWMAKRAKKLAQRKLKEYDDARRPTP
jgi:hypothetical protein